MLITREVDYGLRILGALSKENQLSTGELSKEAFIPKQFAYKIIKKLNKAGFIKTFHGATGGNRLNVNLEEKSLYDLLVACDSLKGINLCMTEGYSCPLKEASKGKCSIHNNLDTIQSSIEKELKTHSIKSLLTEG